MVLPPEDQQDIREARIIDEERERVRLTKVASVRTSTRSTGARVARGTPGATAQARAAIPRVAPRSGIKVTRPAESRIQTSPNATGFNELGGDFLPQNRNKR